MRENRWFQLLELSSAFCLRLFALFIGLDALLAVASHWKTEDSKWVKCVL